MGPINFDVKPLIYFAFIGMVCAGLAIIGGFGWLVWFAINHIQIV